MVSVIGMGAQGHTLYCCNLECLVGKDTGPTLNDDSGTNMSLNHRVYYVNLMFIG